MARRRNTSAQPELGNTPARVGPTMKQVLLDAGEHVVRERPSRLEEGGQTAHRLMRSRQQPAQRHIVDRRRVIEHGVPQSFEWQNRPVTFVVVDIDDSGPLPK